MVFVNRAIIPTCSKYTSKGGMELFRLLTMELCFVNKCVTGPGSALVCRGLVCSSLDYSLMYGWPWKHQY